MVRISCEEAIKDIEEAFKRMMDATSKVYERGVEMSRWLGVPIAREDISRMEPKEVGRVLLEIAQMVLPEGKKEEFFDRYKGLLYYINKYNVSKEDFIRSLKAAEICSI